MIAVLQRVASARVEVSGAPVGAIEKGLLVFVCAEPGDDEALADRLVDRILKLRIFADEADKMNLSVVDVGGGLLVVSQFTLAADASGGNRPSFSGAATSELGRRLYRARAGHRARPACARRGRRVRRPHAGAHRQRRPGHDSAVPAALKAAVLGAQGRASVQVIGEHARHVQGLAPAPSWIWCRQLVPSATTIARALAHGRQQRSSAICMETSWCSAS